MYDCYIVTVGHCKSVTLCNNLYTYVIFSKLFYSVFVREVSIIQPIYSSTTVYGEPTLYECFHFNDDVPVIFHEIRIARFSLWYFARLVSFFVLSMFLEFVSWCVSSPCLCFVYSSIAMTVYTMYISSFSLKSILLAEVSMIFFHAFFKQIQLLIVGSFCAKRFKLLGIWY